MDLNEDLVLESFCINVNLKGINSQCDRLDRLVS